MGALNAWIVSRIRGSMKVVFALAVIIACVAANGSMPTIAEREVDIIPEDEGLIQAKADEETEFVQSQRTDNFLKEVATMASSGRAGILGRNIETGAAKTVVENYNDSAGSTNAEPTEAVVAGPRGQKAMAEGNDALPTVFKEDNFAPEIGARNPSQSVLNPSFRVAETERPRGVEHEIRKLRSAEAISRVDKLYK